ncbi:condensation protein [Streptomyces sp. NPDC053499]|uniref:condensation protein n=1 Tax=Streptomyces sp. NPDC053499 TaxID=3365707 RepID=UPI0037D1203B
MTPPHKGTGTTGSSAPVVVSGGAAPKASAAGAPGEGKSGAEQRIPFPTVDEITRHCLDDDEPETVHVEIHLPGLPDPDRLRAAFAEAMRRHPRILLRQAPTRWWAPRYEWVLTEQPDRDPVSFPGGTLEEARCRALAQCPSLEASPPFRAEVIEGHGGGCVLLVTINHTALDGPACLRVVATAAELYGGADNSPAPPPVRTAPAQQGGADERPSPGGRLWTRPARVAADTRHPAAPGNGMLIAELPVPARPSRTTGLPAPYTVNDQLLVATWLMVARWNSAHERPVRPVRITMPVDDRPRTLEMPIGNGTRLVEVTFGAQERELHRVLTAPGAPDREAVERLLRATAARTRALKSVRRPQLGFSGDLLTTPLLPVGLRATGIRTLRRAAGPWASTTLLSNIGRIPYPLDFGDAGRARAVWFSAPAKVPRGLSVTTVSTGGRLQLALRWSHARLDDSGGERLGALFAEALAATSYTPRETPCEAAEPDEEPAP